MSKKKFFMIVKIIVVVLIALYIISVVRKTLILKKIYKETDMNISKDNYSMIIESKESGGNKKTQAFYNGGRGKQIASNGVYTWNNQKYYFIIDENKKEIRTLDTENYVDSAGIITKSTFATFIPGYFKSFGERVLLVLNPFNAIRNYNLNGEKTYRITLKENNKKYKSTKDYWISKKDYTIKESIVVIYNKETKQSQVLEYTYDIKFLGVSVKDTEFINVDGYTLVDGKTGESRPATDAFKDE